MLELGFTGDQNQQVVDFGKEWGWCEYKFLSVVGFFVFCSLVFFHLRKWLYHFHSYEQCVRFSDL